MGRTGVSLPLKVELPGCQIMLCPSAKKEAFPPQKVKKLPNWRCSSSRPVHLAPQEQATAWNSLVRTLNQRESKPQPQKAKVQQRRQQRRFQVGWFSCSNNSCLNANMDLPPRGPGAKLGEKQSKQRDEATLSETVSQPGEFLAAKSAASPDAIYCFAKDVQTLSEEHMAV